MATIQKVEAGVFKFGLSQENRGRAAIPGTVFISIDNSSNVTGDIRVHDGVRLGGISTPPPGTVSHMIPSANTSSPLGFDVRDGWLLCDGSHLNKDEYGALYSAIGDYWNEDPALAPSNFQIPDLRGYFIRCYSGPRYDGSGNLIFGHGTRQEDTVKKHSHYVLLEPSGGHTHQYVNWQVNSNFSNPTAAAPAGVLNAPGLPGDQTRAAYAVAKPNSTNVSTYALGDNDVYYDTVGGGGDNKGWSISNEPGNPISSTTHISLGESFTRAMNTTTLHKHYMLTQDASDMYEGTFANHEGTCFNIKIPTFIKY